MATGRFDLSTGAIASLTGVVFAIVYRDLGSLALAIAVTVAVTIACGALNWFLTCRAQIPALVATLATMFGLRSLALVSANGRVIAKAPTMPMTFAGEAALSLLAHTAILCLVVGICWCIVRQCVPLSRVYAVGGNEAASMEMGISPSRTVLLAYLVNSFGAAGVGILQVLRSGAASPIGFQDLSLEAIAAAVIGGTSLKGGRGSVLGAAVGLLIMVSLRNSIVHLGFPVYWRGMVSGCLLLAAVIFSHRVTPTFARDQS